MKNWKNYTLCIWVFISIVSILISCDNGNNIEQGQEQPQFRETTINFVFNENPYSTIVQGMLLNSQWTNVVEKIETNVNVAYEEVNAISKMRIRNVFNDTPTIIVEVTTEYNSYKVIDNLWRTLYFNFEALDNLQTFLNNAITSMYNQMPTIDGQCIHKWGDWQVTIYPTCEDTGIGTRYCTFCGVADDNTTIPNEPNAHKSENWIVSTNVGVATNGLETGNCSICGAIGVTRIIYATGTVGLAYTAINNGREYSVTRGTITSGDVYIPEYHRPDVDSVYLPVTEIGTNAFYYPEPYITINSVTIGNNVKSIRSSAFHNCVNLEKIIIPKSVTYIDDVFYNCPNLTNIIIDNDNANYISEGGILYNKSKTTLIAYPSASGEVNIPNTITLIESYSFGGCINLTSINIPNTVTLIGFSAFRDCENLNNVNIPNSVQEIRGYAFTNTNLTNVIIPNGIETIANDTFSFCRNLISVTIPSSVRSINEMRAFGGCNNLTNIIVDSNNQYFSSEKGILYNKDKTIIISFPSANGEVVLLNSITAIGGFAFNNTKITNIIIPDNVISIGSYAFSGTELTSVIIPDSVITIGNSAFFYNLQLANVQFKGSITPENFAIRDAFPGDLRDKYFSTGGGIGTYTTEYPGYYPVWTKQYQE